MRDFLGLHWQLIFGLPSYAWTAIITPIVLGLIPILGRLRARQADGWLYLSPNAPLYLFGIIWLFMGIVFTVSGAITIVLLVRDSFSGTVDASLWTLAILSPPLAFMGWYAVSYLLVRTKFNDTGIERSFLRRTSFFPWADVVSVTRHWFYGPTVRMRNGNYIVVWEYLRGFREFVEAAKRNMVPVDI